MPTLKQRFSSYIRQLSFVAEPPRQNRFIANDCFIRKYLEKRLETRTSGPEIYSSKDPDELPDWPLFLEEKENIKLASCTGPDEGLTAIKRSKLHLSTNGKSDIDFIDDEDDSDVRKAVTRSRSKCSQAELQLSGGAEEDRSRNSISKFNWNAFTEQAYGLSVSLYEKNPVTMEVTGNPNADCFAIIQNEKGAILAMADGVNWGDGARIAARAAIYGAMDYLQDALFEGDCSQDVQGTREVARCLLQCIAESHQCILEVGGKLSTLTVATVLPLASPQPGKAFAVCSITVGDSLGFIYSKEHGVREFTKGSHDTTLMRDLRDALGALGPALNGNKPELSNLTLALTLVDEGDIVFLTSDGISDNFDPCVGKFAEPINEKSVTPPPQPPALAPKRQNKSTSAVVQPSSRARQTPPSANARPSYNRSRTMIEAMRPGSREERPLQSTLPSITALQRHELTLLRLDDLLSYGINGVLRPCDSAKKLCHLLIDFARMITSARRNLLEQRENYVKVTKDERGRRQEVQLSKYQQKMARKRLVESSSYSCCPGKLDHASACAFVVGGRRRVVDQGLGESKDPKTLIETDF